MAKQIRADVSVLPSRRSGSPTDWLLANKDWAPYDHCRGFSAPSRSLELTSRSQVNNAGIARGKTILDTTPEEFLLTYKVNVLGCHNILREFLPHSASFSSQSLGTGADLLAVVISIKCATSPPSLDLSDRFYLAATATL